MSRLTHYYILLLIAACLPLGSAAQMLRQYPLPTQRQMSTAQVHAVTQSHDGLMWYATSDGLCRDNGYQVDVFKRGANDGGVMRSNNIRCLAAGEGRLVFGTTDGAYCLDLKTYRMDSIPLPQNAGREFYSVLMASDKTVWLESDRSIVRLEMGTGRTGRPLDARVISVFHDPGCAGGAIYEDSQHRIWHLQWEHGISVYTRDGDNFRKLPWSGPCPNAMCESADGRYWIGTFGGGVVLYDYRSGRQTPQQASLCGDDDDKMVISMVTDDRYGLLWVTTMNGLACYRQTGGEIFGEKVSPENVLEKTAPVANLPQGNLIVDMLYKDRNGDIWVPGFSPTTFIITLNGGGVVRMGVPEMRQATGYGLLADRMIADGNGYYWIWQGRKGLALYHEGTAPVFEPSFAYYDSGVTATAISKCSNAPGILLGRYEELWQIAHDGMSMDRAPLAVVKGQWINGIRQDRYGRVWIATDTGIFLFSHISSRLWRLGSDRVSVIGGPTFDGNACWYASGSRLCRVDVKGIKNAIDIGETVNSVAIDTNDSVWAATDNGHVYCCSGLSCSRHPEMDDMRGRKFNQIAVDNWANIWTLTDQEVCRYDYRSKLRMSWSASDPDIGVDYFYALEPESRGMGVAGAGAYCVLPYNVKYADGKRVMPPYVTTVTTTDSTYLIGMGKQTVELPPEASALELSLSTGEHLFADKVTFAYRLGKKGDWTVLEQGRNRAYLSRLPVGETDFYVRVADRYGNWGAERLCLTIDRRPAWYEAWWAILLYILTGVVFVGVLIFVAKRIGRLHDLMELRDEMNIRQVSLTPDDISNERYDSDFTRKLIGTIEAHIGDADYNVGRLAIDMGMSRASLFRKAKAMTGKGPTDIIKEIRLKNAARLLQEDGKATIADIAAKVGFATPQYFTKCFKDMFGVQPNQYRRQ